MAPIILILVRLNIFAPQFITYAADCLYLCPGVYEGEFFSGEGHVYLHVIVLGFVIVSPDLESELLSGEDVSLVCYHVFKNAEFFVA